ncbi:WXG100 family type VII secretion target [Psychromicrobium silvestre]|uniref:ESAT-6-like protein n=1 Tax=Psychromicrobium silvestre TaxID=1645614 RepID=A0A7Y9S4L3_9MICC|nr:WXG100 family type VII secretion target [Psychromicrobium silvestre]NYE94488.1 WXG100 family type VII secretion target [Psychromicrobium silvestre]
MAEYKVTSEQLSHVSTQLSSGSADIEGKLSNLNAQVKALIDNDWQGGASTSFNDLYEQFHRAGMDLKSALDGISHQLGAAAREYEQTEHNVTSGFRS